MEIFDNANDNTIHAAGFAETEFLADGVLPAQLLDGGLIEYERACRIADNVGREIASGNEVNVKDVILPSTRSPTIRTSSPSTSSPTLPVPALPTSRKS